MLGFTLCHIPKSHMLTFVQPCLVPCTVELRGPVWASGVYLTLVVGVGEPLGEPQLPAGHPSLHIGPPVVTDPTLIAQVGQIYLSCVWSVRGQGNGVLCPIEVKIRDTYRFIYFTTSKRNKFVVKCQELTIIFLVIFLFLN